MFLVPKSCAEVFQRAGWFEGRSIPIVTVGLDMVGGNALGNELLRQFGGLRVGPCGAGQECATSDIEFLARVSSDEQYMLTEVQTADYFPIGWAHHGHMMLYIDRAGRILSTNTETPGVAIVGETFEGAMEILLLGRKFGAGPQA